MRRSPHVGYPYRYPESDNASVFERLRERVPVEEIVGSHCDFRGNKVRCVAPSHADADPSMQLYGDHVDCFSCGFHGDVTDIWGAMRGISGAIDAALDLAREYGVEVADA